jgi:phosphoribosylaminoimidazolecarboxamide formyltransferase / IMP cyclohydrolase
MKIQRALISVSDKVELQKLADVLAKHKVEMIASGGSKKFLEDLGHKVTAVESITGNPEAFQGRMKTLSFELFSSLLYKRSSSHDLEEAKNLKIKPIDLVVCNFYPFEEKKEKLTEMSELIEFVDIGGPSMVRAAAKNYESVCILTSPFQYEDFVSELESHNEISRETRLSLMKEAFKRTYEYEKSIYEKFYVEEKKLRYGENPSQSAVVKVYETNSLASATSLQGKELSYNNYLDMQAAYETLTELQKISSSKKIVTIVKHTNPCGAAMSSSLVTSLEYAWKGDQISSFGSIICFSHEVDLQCAKYLKNKFVEILMAPSFSKEALELFQKKSNLRLLATNFKKSKSNIEVKSIHGGELIQERDYFTKEEFQLMTGSNEGFDQELASFGVVLCKELKSNAINLVMKEQDIYYQIGMGSGNPNRLVSVKQALEKAQENLSGEKNTLSEAYLISDAFFPFRDNLDLLASLSNVKTIIEPGGSIKDDEVITAAKDHKMNLYFTGKRHFKH